MSLDFYNLKHRTHTGMGSLKMNHSPVLRGAGGAEAVTACTPEVTQTSQGPAGGRLSASDMPPNPETLSSLLRLQTPIMDEKMQLYASKQTWFCFSSLLVCIKMHRQKRMARPCG